MKKTKKMRKTIKNTKRVGYQKDYPTPQRRE